MKPYCEDDAVFGCSSVLSCPEARMACTFFKDGLGVNVSAFLTGAAAVFRSWFGLADPLGILLFYLIGFTATVPIILFILTYMLSKVSAPDTPKKQRIIKILIFAIVAGALIYCAYILGLQARLPKGIIWKLFK